MTQRSEDKFDPITGVPQYPLKNCEYTIACSYPYCSCRVPHNRDHEPQPEYTRGWNWELMLVLLVLALFWVATGVEIDRLWPW